MNNNNSTTGGPVVLPTFVFEFTDVQIGLAWFRATFGCLFIAVALGFVARFYQVRNVFEIKARSPYLVMLGGVSLLGMVGLPAYTALTMIDQTAVPMNVYVLFTCYYFFVFCFFISFWGRIIRLGLAYCPRYKRKLPWLMSERLLVCVCITVSLASLSMPLYKMRTIKGPFAQLIFAVDQKDQLTLCQVMLLIATIVVIPIVWHVDDLFKIRTELFVATVLQIVQTVGNAITNKYGSEKISEWINQENNIFVAAVIMFCITVIDPLRRLAFAPMSKSNRALARAHAQRKNRCLRTSNNGQLSQITEPDSQLESQCSQPASASELGTPRRRKWSYENLAAVPGLAAAFRAFAFRALCEESVVFLEEVSRYENGEFSMSPPEIRDQKAAFSAIVVRFIVDGSVDEVNISWADKKQILELNRSDAHSFDMLDEEQKRTVFAAVYVEIRRVLETNLLQRFTETPDFVKEEQKGTPTSRPRRHRGSGSNGSSDSNGADVVQSQDQVVHGHNNSSARVAQSRGRAVHSQNGSSSADVVQPQRSSSDSAQSRSRIVHSSSSSSIDAVQYQDQASQEA